MSDCQVLLRARFYVDRPTKFAPEQIVMIEVARPLPQGAHLPSVLNFIGQRLSDTRVNLGVPDQDMRRKPFGFCGPGVHGYMLHSDLLLPLEFAPASRTSERKRSRFTALGF
jgi:hypothetical protein